MFSGITLMLKRLIAAIACLAFGTSSTFAASSNVNSLGASGAIIGTQLVYCPIGASTDFKCTFTQIDTFINAQFSGDCTAAAGGALTCTKTNGTAFGALATVTPGTGIATGAAAAVNSTTAGSISTTVIPLAVGTGGTISTADGYYVCTTTCSVTLPTPAAGYQFCIRNDSTVTTVITIAAITSVLFEKTSYNGYGTVTTGTMVSGGALGDKICLIGRDSTHYLVGAFVGTWTNS